MSLGFGSYPAKVYCTPKVITGYLKSSTGRLSQVQGGESLISHNVNLKLFYKSLFPHKFVDFLFALVVVEDKLADLWGT
jgi:hypothetical protein